MLSYKSSFILLLVLVSTNTFANKFSSKECFDASFETKINNDGKFFGLVKSYLNIRKEKCIVEITFKEYLETTWKIDICREPIHIKVTSKGSQDVYKKKGSCEGKKEDGYCQFRGMLEEYLQDYGLIYADGQKENLADAHGQVYCSYLLINRYLNDDIVFSPYEPIRNIYKDQASCAIPGVKKEEPANIQMDLESSKKELYQQIYRDQKNAKPMFDETPAIESMPGDSGESAEPRF